MDRPRLFLSAVSQELRTARNAVAATVRTLGYDPVSQDDFPTGHGELRRWLCHEIDSCQGLIQIVGQAFGAEPPEVAPEWGRVSYTQFEFLYARRQGKKTWLFIAGEHCQRDRPPEDLDLPQDSAHPNPAGFQAERRRLQQDYVARLQGENHLWHLVENPTELENVVLRLRDELGELRGRWERQQRRLTGAIAAILVVLVLLGGGIWWGYRLLHRDVQQATAEARQAGAMTTERIRAHLLETAAQTYREEQAEADKATDWRDRQRLRQAADAANAARLARIEDLAASFAAIEGRGAATGVFAEMTRILAEQGVDEAIAYVESQRPDILKTVAARTSAAHQANRADLESLLKAAALQESKGQSTAARTLYTQVLGAEPDWPDALHAYLGFLVDQGDAACIRTTLADARRDYFEAQGLARRLTAADPANSEWQSDLAVSYQRLGNVARAQGKLEDAARDYADGLAIFKRLAEAEPGNSDWQRDLSVSYDKLGEVARARGRLEDAAGAYGEGLAIAKKLVASNPANTQWQRDLSESYNNLGDVAMAQGKPKDAGRAYAEALAIAKRLANTDPGNVLWQRDLAVSYQRLGTLAATQDKLDDAARAFGDALAITKRLTAADPGNTQWQRDLSVAYDNLGDVARAQGKLGDAARAYADALAIAKRLAGVDPANTDWQRDLAVSYNKLGDVAMAQAKLDDAARAYADGLAIVKRLVAADPGKTDWQRDLSISYNKLGEVALAQGRLDDAARAYADALAIRKRLADADPTNTQWQRDLAMSYCNLAEVAQRQNKPDVALGYWKQAIDVLSGIEKRGLHLSPLVRGILDDLRKKVAAGSAKEKPAEGKR